MSYVDFGELKARVSIEDAVHLLGLEMKRVNHQFRGPCPVCQSGGDRALCVTPAKSAFYCFAARKGGDQIALVQHVNEIGAKDAAQFLDGNGTSTRKGTSSRKGNSPEEREERREPSEGFRPLQYLQTEADALSATELTAETLVD